MKIQLYLCAVLVLLTVYLSISVRSVPGQSAFAGRDSGLTQSACLQPGIKLDDIVEHRGGSSGITVRNKLNQLRAHCLRGKLVDGKRHEIRFFRQECWGNPPPDYLEIERRQKAELERLKKRYTVIVFNCDMRQVV
jgi:hypothetical protein